MMAPTSPVYMSIDGSVCFYEDKMKAWVCWADDGKTIVWNADFGTRAPAAVGDDTYYKWTGVDDMGNPNGKDMMVKSECGDSMQMYRDLQTSQPMCSWFEAGKSSMDGVKVTMTVFADSQCTQGAMLDGTPCMCGGQGGNN